MSEEIIELDYGKAEKMSQTFRAGVENLQDTLQEMQNLASMLEEGALLGRAGETFVQSIRGALCPSIAKLMAKYQELDGDVQQAVNLMREADSRAAQGFGSG
ncbi:MAG TPA: WXG100 family type VII secretion target [Chloroflexia bacterium]|jgi:WXG100 family type VII secretion target